MASELIPVGNLGQNKLLQDSTTFVAEVVVAMIRDGESITVESLPSVTVVSLPSVTVASLPSVTVASMPAVTVASITAIDINSIPSVTVGAVVPSLTIASLPSITVGAIVPSVTVGAMPASTTVGGTVTADQGTAGAAAWPVKLPATWYITGASGLNAAQTLTKAAVVDQRHYITGFTVSLWGAPAAQEIEAALNDDVIKAFSAIIGEGASTGERLTEQFSHPIQMGVNTAVTLVIDAGGAGVGTIANLLGYTQ